ncbi:MAG: tRNA (adenosine(37)-N6)-threonylcarbamoyltransferase complex dimerization subunit type 1 TsaB [Bacteroidota bacterium]
MALILNLETGTEICSVALGRDGVLLELAENIEGNMHSSVITLLIQEVLQKQGLNIKEIEAVSISKGPGSYTGLRVGTSAAKGICLGLDVPLIAIDSLKALAFAMKLQSDEEGLYVPMIDARRMEVYTCLFDEDLKTLEEISPKIIDESSYHALLESGTKLILGGNGAEKCKPILKSGQITYTNVLSSAKNLVFLSETAYSNGKMEQLGAFSPFYLKGANVTKSRKKLF